MSIRSHLDDQAAPPTWSGPGRLALTLQEVLTATVRLRAGRHQGLDAHGFRQRIRALIQSAERDALGAGYTSDYVRLAIYAVTSLLDEAVLNHAQPALAEWARKPLQDELFGDSRGGERFFQQLRQLLAVADSAALADLLEVYLLCLLLGFRGRYAVADGGELHALRDALVEKIERVRGVTPELSPDWRPTGDGAPVVRRDPWVRRIALGAAAAAVLAAALGLGVGRALDGGVAAVQAEASAVSATPPASDAREPR